MSITFLFTYIILSLPHLFGLSGSNLLFFLYRPGFQPKSDFSVHLFSFSFLFYILHREREYETECSCMYWHITDASSILFILFRIQIIFSIPINTALCSLNSVVHKEDDEPKCDGHCIIIKTASFQVLFCYKKGRTWLFSLTLLWVLHFIFVRFLMGGKTEYWNVL